MRATVRVAVATLWREPHDDPADVLMLGETTDIRGWCAQLPRERRMDQDSVLGQLLLGEQVVIDSERDGWAHVVVTGQPSRFDPRGYPGWLPRHQLTEASDETEDLLVAATATTLRDAPDGDLVLRGVVLGTRLRTITLPGRRHLADEGDDDRDGDGDTLGDEWWAVGVPGEVEPLWGRALDLTPVPQRQPAARDVLMTATRLRDTPYVWGGMTPFGIDCSGLVHLSWRRHGVVLPRDACDQALATTPVEFGEERPGDLYFFARPGEPVHHVGIVAAAPRNGKRVMLHASSSVGHVVIEELTGDRFADLVSAARVPL
ncbi:hypothetical protein F4553_002657 [Allocatelliglobosispora scoriae]|uniref:NlpC/P60 domain-containing protein n=1 Tax=Allocatelliglobosispora scoriae TaxID=643052 RepID=A0A841BPH8_9ACTN|nr:C40 family peptidase [Allocatelliglobosispora scoriae]MBB5869278.1 hypothetical protein [Allocatelliglobosispora scoriae]